MYIITKIATLKNTTKSLSFAAINLILLSYTQTASAFTVELFKSNTTVNNLSDADALIGGTNLQSTSSGTYDVIDFIDVAYGLPWGRSSIDNLFPGTFGFPNVNHYAVRVTAEIEITTADDWTFLTSNDDGLRLRIDGSDVIVDDNLHPTEDNLGTVNLSAGTHDLELVYFEQAGEGTLELWAAQGNNYTEYNSNFRLVGDSTNGGIATVPFEFSPGIGIILSLSIIGLQ